MSHNFTVGNKEYTIVTSESDNIIVFEVVNSDGSSLGFLSREYNKIENEFTLSSNGINEKITKERLANIVIEDFRNFIKKG